MTNMKPLIPLLFLFLSVFFCGVAIADELIYIDAVGPQTIGEPFTLTGSADLPAGTVLHIHIVPVDAVGISISSGPSKEMVWGETLIEKGTCETGGVWRYTVNTSNLLPTSYFVRVYSDDVKYPYSERATAFTARLPGENTLIHPPESGVVFTGDTTIDTVQPDKKTAEAFMQSSVYDTVIACLMQKDTPENLPEEIRNLTLTDFPYHTADGEIMIRNITVAELLENMNTTFTGHGWGSSYRTHDYIEISVGDPAWETDLINAWNLIQAIAQQNGFDKTIPVQFANIKIISGGNETIPKPTATSLPLAGVLGGLGIAAVLAHRRR